MINVSDYPEISSVIGFFEEISKIPRGSKNTSKIAEYLYNFGIERGLESYRDGFDNVVIKKPASRGLEDRPAVVIQGHSDIVAEKTPDCILDMANDGLELYRDGDFIRARGTTLGADDGIAVAYALALLDSKDIPHPALECVFTSDEETGLTGAENIDGDLIRGRMMINIDSDEEGVFTVGCAGGARTDIALPVLCESASGNFFRLTVSGLLGGHSGVDIDKGRVNAVKLLCALLKTLPDIRLASLAGGNADNAIPRDASAVFLTEKISDASALCELAKSLAVGEEPQITLEKAEGDTALSSESTQKVLCLVDDLPSGVHKMSSDIEGLVETSSNLGVCRLSGSRLCVTVSVRSSIEGEKLGLIEKIRSIAEGFGAEVSVRGNYPGWAYKKESPLRERMVDCYKKMYGKDPKVVMIHAGLECGLFSDKLSGLDCISLGPDNFDIHTPNEHLSISSAARVWEFLLEVLKY